MKTATAKWISTRSFALFATVTFFACLLGESAYCWKTPVAFFDTMAYVSIAEGGGNGFAVAGSECGTQLPGKRNGCADSAGTEMFHTVTQYSDPDFLQAMRFYKVKPLYCALATGLHRGMRLPAFAAFRVISWTSFVLTGVVVWVWLREHMPAAAASLIAPWLMASGTVLALGKDLLPDGLSTSLLLLAIYCLLYRRTMWPAAAATLLALLARPDNILFVACFGAALIFTTRRTEERRWMLPALWVAACVAFSLVLSKATGALPWSVLFRRSFLEFVSPAQFATTHVTLQQYVHVLLDNGVRVVLFCLPLAALLATIALLGEKQESNLKTLVLASTCAVALRIVLYPGVEDRFYVWFYVVCALAAACVMAERAGLSVRDRRANHELSFRVGKTTNAT